jgi:hypothetical protein
MHKAERRTTAPGCYPPYKKEYTCILLPVFEGYRVNSGLNAQKVNYDL